MNPINWRKFLVPVIWVAGSLMGLLAFLVILGGILILLEDDTPNLGVSREKMVDIYVAQGFEFVLDNEYENDDGKRTRLHGVHLQDDVNIVLEGEDKLEMFFFGAKGSIPAGYITDAFQEICKEDYDDCSDWMEHVIYQIIYQNKFGSMETVINGKEIRAARTRTFMLSFYIIPEGTEFN